ncbi:hypothetical protein PCANC_05524 [Puccinia coronata f. sp. avenae]|uniref:Uncharacterized protein n=1 Tax=Puccinia coronata f. sp. avenae TaxID=200324 RepID=A0A2N5VJI7_9BASI|nr:hypothetical protein PCANC_16552 [Puccinia coronata f. sp. avenae]PLW50153.1 hypothetical protein PCASD_01829 [Puccinia coronata f. sp. avenae]PLW51768.1 hypothetical protein PCANC_05524 [Puccinia coronata f. sp. avenae]
MPKGRVTSPNSPSASPLGFRAPAPVSLWPLKLTPKPEKLQLPLPLSDLPQPVHGKTCATAVTVVPAQLITHRPGTPSIQQPPTHALPHTTQHTGRPTLPTSVEG